MRKLGLALLPLLALPACGKGSTTAGSPVESVPVGDTLKGAGLSAPVDVVRDEYGVPHIYGATLEDVLYAQGYVTAQDRLVEMALIRRKTEGTLAELLGSLKDALIDDDIQARMHHQR